MLRTLPVPKRSRVNATTIAMSNYSAVRQVYHGVSSRRDRELKYSSQPIVKDQATRTPKAWISDSDSSLCGPSKTLKLMTVPLTHQCSNCAKATLYKKMTPQLLNVKLVGSPKRKAYSYQELMSHPKGGSSCSYIDQESKLKKTYVRASCASTACIVHTYTRIHLE